MTFTTASATCIPSKRTITFDDDVVLPQTSKPFQVLVIFGSQSSTPKKKLSKEGLSSSQKQKYTTSLRAMKQGKSLSSLDEVKAIYTSS